MKFIHIADIHASKQRLPQTLHILKILTERAKQGDIDFILFAGDFYDSTMTVTKASGFSDILKAKRELEEYVTLYFVSGTPSHEPNGCLDAFKSDKTYVFDSNQTVIIPRITDDVSDPYLYDKTYLVCIPEPRRSNFISKSSKETDRLINNSIKEFINIQKEHNVGKYKETIVMYHGEVKGAVYQNGISASSPTAVSKELLQSLKADYYALGHIHMPQEVFPNAWYSGSACPKDFGETHDGCYNLIEIKDGKTSVERVSFGLPIYATYNVDYPFEMPHGDWSNYNIRFKFNITKEQKKVLDIKYLAKTIKDKTNAISVKLEPNIIEGENVFVSEVTKHKSIVWKMIEYAKEKNIAIPKYARGLLQDIEDNTLTKLAYPQHSFELLSLSLRGSIGIRDGQHKDDFNLNFEQYEDGVVCLIGNCGTGKCITGDSFILSEKGFETIGSYDNNEKGFRPFKKSLFSEKGNIAESSHFYAEEVSETIKIKNSLGMELEGTPEHPVLVFTPDCTYKFKMLSELNTNDFVCIPRGMNVFPKDHYKFNFTPIKVTNCKDINLPFSMNKNLAKFIGYYIANGSHTKNTIQFCTKNKNIGNDYIKCVKETFDISVVETPCKNGATNYRIFSSVIRQFLEYIFNSNLKTGRYKTIPNCILQGTKDEQIAFITTLFDCDGSLTKNTFEYSSASKQIIIVLQNMLLNFGIISSHRIKRVKGYNWNYHRLVISSLNVDNLFYRILSNSLKYHYIRNIDANTNIDIVPYLKKKIHNELPRLKNGYLKSKDGNLYRNPIRITNLKNELSYASLDTLISSTSHSAIPEIKELNSLCRNIAQKFYFFSKVENIEKLNQHKMVYDFSIPSTHKFYSNGFISHNSTILENCHPYPCMLTREGTLKDHFYLKDSHRILIYKDENGLYYKISMLIDGKTASGKVSYFVETSKNREQWNSVPEVDGSLETYKQWVESTFGGKDIFLRTAFFAKEPVKDTTDISETTKSERMELLSKLAGTEHLKAVSKIAHELRVGNKQKKIIGIEDTIETIENEIKSFSHYEDTIEENEKNINSWNDELKQQEQYISDLEDKFSKLKEKDREYQKVKAVAETNAELYSRYNSEYNTLSENIDILEDAVANQNIFNDVTEANSFINENIPAIEDKNKELESKKAVGDELAKTLLNLTRKKNEIDLSIKEINISINSCKEKITDVNDVCPTCGAKLSEEKKKELNKIVSEAEAELKELEYKEYELQLDLGKALFDINEKEAEKSVIDNEIDFLKKSIDYLNCKCNEYTEFLDSLNDVYKTHTYDETLNELEQSKASIKELQSKMDSIANTSMIEDVSEQLENAEYELKNKQTSLAEIKANINAAKKQNEEYDKELRLVADKKEKLEELKDTAIAYSFIEDAFSNNGIPAIELRESAPEIADIANKILADSYGNKFTVRFGSSSDLKANRKANEDFNIIVYDSENDDEKTIDNVSSGEKIWIKQALFYAFSIVQMNRTGFNFRVRLIDESDGSLDGGLRPKYLKMVTSAHEQASARLTILITHSQEIKDIAQQIIEI